jgi:small subunit ribosomal protein S21
LASELPAGHGTAKKAGFVKQLGLSTTSKVTYSRMAQMGRLRGVVDLAEVRVQEGEPLENALRRFKRKVQQEDIIKEVKRHSFYLKPGERRRVKEALARKRNRKKARKEQD